MFGDGYRALRRGTVKYEHPAYVLDRRCSQPVTDMHQQRVALVTVAIRGSHLDQFMTVETRCDFFDHAVGKPLVTDENNRL